MMAAESASPESNPYQSGGHEACFFFDESGFVGFIEKRIPSQASEAPRFGLIAGIALPAGDVPDFEQELEDVFSDLSTEGCIKRHATELFAEGKNSGIREDLWSFLSSRSGWCLLYEAVYVDGVRQHLGNQDTIIQSRAGGESSIRPSRNPRKTRLYTLLLEGIIYQLDEVCSTEKTSKIDLLTDPVDEALLREARTELASLRNNDSEQHVTGWSEESGVVHGTVSIKLRGLDNRVRRVGRIVADKNHPHLVLAADTIANTLHHHLKTRMLDDPDFPTLHSREVLEGFPLADRVAFLDQDYLTDIVYRPDDSAEGNRNVLE